MRSPMLIHMEYQYGNEGKSGKLFQRKHHLGNNRVVADASSSAIQVTHYYPFVMSLAEGFEKEGVKPAKQPYKYNGKELVL